MASRRQRYLRCASEFDVDSQSMIPYRKLRRTTNPKDAAPFLYRADALDFIADHDGVSSNVQVVPNPSGRGFLIRDGAAYIASTSRRGVACGSLYMMPDDVRKRVKQALSDARKLVQYLQGAAANSNRRSSEEVTDRLDAAAGHVSKAVFALKSIEA